LITSKKDGLWVNYMIADGDESPYAAHLIGSLKHWLDNDPDIKILIAQLPGIDRSNICSR
jgi:ArsR family transcriptional regulator